MDIEFINKKMHKACNSSSEMVRRWGPKMAKKLQQRLVELAAANTLADMKGMPGHCHELTANRKGRLAVNLFNPIALSSNPAIILYPLTLVVVLTGQRLPGSSFLRLWTITKRRRHETRSL